MAMRITNEVLEAYLNCKTKGYLKLVGETGTKSDYEAMTEAASQASREVSLAGIVARYGEGNAHRGAAITAAMLKQARRRKRMRALHLGRGLSLPRRAGGLRASRERTGH